MSTTPENTNVSTDYEIYLLSAFTGQKNNKISVCPTYQFVKTREIHNR